MTRCILLAALVLSAVSPVLAQALSLTVDRPRQDFAIGEEIVFRVESARSGTLRYELGYSERAGLFETGERAHDGGVTEVRYRPGVACFLFVRVRLAGESAELGVAVGRDDIGALAAEPDDFDAFWAGEKAALAAVPLDVRREQIAETEYSTSYRFSAAQLDGRRVHGFLTVPKGVGPKPAALRLPPYGMSGPGGPAHRIAEKGNVISATITIHDAPAGQRAESAYDGTDARDRDRIYYRYGMTAALRAIDVIAAMPEWDRENVLVYGDSQGGGLAMLTAGIDARVTQVYQAVAALSQHNGPTVGQASGFPYFLEKAEDMFGPAALPAARAAVKYYDAIYGARRFRGPSMHFVNYKDPVCPPATHYAATNEMAGPRVVLHSLDLGHTSPPEFEDELLAFLRTHVPGASNPPFTYESKHVSFRVSAGIDLDAQTGTPVTLRGDAGYDGAGPGADWTAAWKVVDGPGAVTFDNADALAAAATFSSPGNYRLRLQVTAPHERDARKYYLLLDEVTVDVAGGTSPVEGAASASALRVFPNPVHGDLHVAFEGTGEGVVRLALYDLLGREVLTAGDLPVTPGLPVRRTLATAGLPAGSYLLVLRGATDTQQVPVVVE